MNEQPDAYRTVVADPPWLPRLHAGMTQFGRQKPRPQMLYPTLSVGEVCRFPLPRLAAQSHLWLWVLNPHVDWGYSVARAWGFEPQQMVTWCKPGLGTGRFQSNTESVLVCRRGSPAGNAFGPTVGTWHRWPRGRHSAKPDGFYELVERVSPGPRVELFGRRLRNGWTVLGNEVPESTPVLFREGQVA